jgi:hypothetical protein
MKINLLSLKNSALALSVLSFAVLSSCSNSAVNTEETKETVTNESSPSVAPGQTSDNNSVSVSPTTDENPQTAQAAAAGVTKMTFTETLHDFGNVKEGEKVTHMFKFKNTGDKPLIITNAKGSCGCTVPDYPRNPIAPGESSQIKVEYNSKGKKGSETKYVTLNANIEGGETKLTIKANVSEVAK